MIKFGDVFRYKEMYYIFLASNESTVFTARILDEEKSRQLINMRERLHVNASRSGTYDKPLLLFVELSSEGFENQVAHLANTHNNDKCENCTGRINDEDAKEILKEIQEDRNIPVTLKELTKDIHL